MSAGASSKKAPNIERQGEASRVIDRREAPHYAAMVRGAAEIGPPISDELSLRLAVRYLGEEIVGPTWHDTRGTIRSRSTFNRSTSSSTAVKLDGHSPVPDMLQSRWRSNPES